MKAEEVAYEVDGIGLIGTFMVDGTREESRPGVLVCHEGPGLTDHTKGIAARIAALGYSVFALDYHGGGKPPAREDVMPRLNDLLANPEKIRALAHAGLNILANRPETDASRIAAVGYCFGGTMVMELAQSGADVRAVVGFHAGLHTARPEDARNITASVLMLIGTDDPHATADDRKQFEERMHAGGVKDWQMHLYGEVGHSYTNPAASKANMPGIGYDERYDKRSWQAMVNLFEEVFAV